MSTLTPLWYHPSTVLMLDDESKFSEFLKKNISDPFLPLVEPDPQKALDYLNRWAYNVKDLSELLMQRDFDGSTDEDNQFYELKFKNFGNSLMCENRHNRALVAIIDRHMPSMDGLDFCEKIREKYQLPIKLILLTGATTQTEVIDAFNSKKIDAYIEKRSNPEMLDQIKGYLNKFAWEQFQELSRSIIGGFGSQLSHLSDKDFYETFSAIREKEQIIEFYVLNSTGSFMLINKNGEAKLLLVHSKDDFNATREIAVDSEAPPDVIEALEQYKQYPVTLSSEIPVSIEGNGWREVMAPVNQVANKDFFYSLILKSELY